MARAQKIFMQVDDFVLKDPDADVLRALKGITNPGVTKEHAMIAGGALLRLQLQ